MQTVLDFIKDLKQNNNRDWFTENKSRYKESLEEFREFCTELIDGIAVFDPALSELDAAKSIFRIYRDVRFSKDKSPYKTHFGCWMTRGGRKSVNAGYYFHLEPGASFLAGGSYNPPKEELKLIREEILYDPKSWLKTINDPVLQEEFQRGMQEEKLSRGPAGFPADFEFIEELKHKHFIFSKNLSDREVVGRNFVKKAAGDYQKLSTLVYYLNNAMSLKGNM